MFSVSTIRDAALATIALMFCIQAHSAQSESPLQNSISGIQVKPGQDGDWLLDYDYFYVGKPMAHFRIELVAKPGSRPVSGFNGLDDRIYQPPKFGQNHISTVMRYPGEVTTEQIIVSLVRDDPGGEVLASQRIDKIIQWPSQDSRDLRYAIDAIDNGSRETLLEARAILERLLTKNPNNDAAYIELARVAMKSNWGPEGLHHAETLLDSALKIKPDNPNAKILLGYVYTHQDRFREAEALFVDAARSNPINLWLWTNWGEMFEKQGKIDQAIPKYREAIQRPLQSARYDGARKNAYTFLLRLLNTRNEVAELETLYQQRIREFGANSCYSADYARFKLNIRGDTQGAIELARAALNLNCNDAPSREILGLASYVQWARGTAPSNNEALNQARIFLPVNPNTLYLLASSEHTAIALKKLTESGERIDQTDSEKMTALGHALQMHKLDAAERLLRHGARPETLVGFEQIPVAMLPVLESDTDAVRVMQRAGVDYSKLRYHGFTAIEYAKRIGDEELLAVLQPKELAL